MCLWVWGVPSPGPAWDAAKAGAAEIWGPPSADGERGVLGTAGGGAPASRPSRIRGVTAKAVIKALAPRSRPHAYSSRARPSCPVFIGMWQQGHGHATAVHPAGCAVPARPPGAHTCESGEWVVVTRLLG